MIRKCLIAILLSSVFMGNHIQVYADGMARLNLYIDGKSVSTPDFQFADGTFSVPFEWIAGQLQIEDNAIWETATSLPGDIAHVKEGKRYIQLRYIGEQSGYLVGWDAASHSVIMNSAALHSVEVLKVLDGFTFLAQFSETEIKQVRLLGVSSLERKTIINRDTVRQKTLELAQQKLEHHTVWLEVPSLEAKEQDVQANVFLSDGTFYNAWLLANGFADLSGYGQAWYPLLHDLATKAMRRLFGFYDKDLLELIIKQGDYVKLWADFQRGVIVVQNTDEATYDLSGWKLSDQTGDYTFTFPQHTISHGIASLSVLTVRPKFPLDKLHNADSTFIWENGPTWNGEGNKVILYDDEGFVISCTTGGMGPRETCSPPMEN